MRYEEFLQRVQDRGGFDTPESAEHVIHATLEVLGQRLLDVDARVVASRLPPTMRDSLLRHGYEGDFDIDELYRRVSDKEGVGASYAVETSQIVCSTLAEMLDDAALQHAKMRLPESLAALFTKEPHAGGPPEQPLHYGQPNAVSYGRSLASGHEGSEHPLSEGNPAHSESIAASDNPHADTKLSTTHGTSSEREEHTLSTGRPGARRPLTEGD